MSARVFAYSLSSPTPRSITLGTHRAYPLQESCRALLTEAVDVGAIRNAGTYAVVVVFEDQSASLFQFQVREVPPEPTPPKLVVI